MDARILKDKALKQMPLFELDALREAFKRSVRDNNVALADWAKHAELFVKNAARKENRFLRA
ncbi:hypothetical protein AB6802_17640 [Mesorhizobium sp. RCC_202]|uniref:hypothetical protein n=1 Tax=Mesorhizobium sp. RCC_202 TaxID=3239222 RepID=UPI00352655A7